MTRGPVNILFLCTANSARSILAEAILSRDGKGLFRAFSAGTRPRGEVHPLTIELLTTLGMPTAGLRSKGLQEFAGRGAPHMDAVITVCEEAAREAFPALPGFPPIVSWGIPDPVAISWDEAAGRAGFLKAYLDLQARIARLVAIPFSHLDREDLHRQLLEVGRLPGRTGS